MKDKAERKETINIESIQVQGKNIIISFKDFMIKKGQVYSLMLKKDKEGSTWNSKSVIANGNQSNLIFDMETFEREITISERVIWSVSLCVSEDNQTKEFILVKKGAFQSAGEEARIYYNRQNRVFSPFALSEVNVGMGTVRCIAFPLIHENESLQILTVQEDNYMQQIIMGKLLEADIKRNIFWIQLEYPKTEYKFSRLLLIYRAKKEEDQTSYEFEVKEIHEQENKIVLEANIDLSTVDLKTGFWDVSLLLVYGKREAKINFRNKSEQFQKKFNRFFYNSAYYFGKKMFAFPYVTLSDSVSLECREVGEYDGFHFKIKERFAHLCYVLMKKYLEKKKIFLIFEKYSSMAQDNAFYLFQYCMEHNMEEKMGRKIYYVIDKKSPDYEVLKPYKNRVLKFMSVRHIAYLLAARLLISTDAKIHCYANKKRGSTLDRRVRNRKLVFLQHGVTAFKKVNHIYGKGRRGACNLFIVTSDFEKEIIEKDFRYLPEEIAVTGFARWDVLKDKSEDSREILLMPTWRNWLEELNEEQFMQSDYYKNYMKLLNAPKLKEILEEQEIQLNFYLHPRFKEYMKNFTSDTKRIRLVSFGEEPLNELLMRCKMLITDYSSVAWDVLYQNKPVLFYQFDLNEYNETSGSYIDMDKDLFGDRVKEQGKLIELIFQYANNAFEMKPEYISMREQYFKYIDENNCQRICECIMKKGW